MNDVIEGILEELRKKTNRKHDAHYEDGKGVLFVPEGYSLKPQYVVLSIHDMQLQFMRMTGRGVDINV